MYSGQKRGESGIHEEPEAFTGRKREAHRSQRWKVTEMMKPSVSVRNKTHVQRKEPIPAQTSNETEGGWTWDSMGLQATEFHI